MRITLPIIFSLFTSIANFGQEAPDFIPWSDTTIYELSQEGKFSDSLQFKITRFFYKDGNIIYEGITDTVRGIIYQKHFLHDGNIDNEGPMNLSGNYHIGKSKYRLPNGKYKIVEFDNPYQTSREKAIEIARERGLKKGRIEVFEQMIDRIYYWQVISWTKEGCCADKGEFLYVRPSNGNVIMPKDNQMESFD